MEPGAIKGGKTEVDINPTTDNRDDNGKKIDDEGKKATKAANAKAGVKEETMNTSKNFGLPADLIKTVEEALKGNQKKIDKNHNGKIDGQDFKILRGEKVKKEEVEEIEEVSKSLAGRTILQRTRKGQNAEIQGKQGEAEKHYGKMASGLKRFGKKFGDKSHEKMSDALETMPLHYEEVEELDELAPATMKSYQGKAADSIGHASQSARSMGSDKDHLKKPLGNEIRKRKKGLNLAGERLAKKNMDEETDLGFTAEELARIEEIAKGLE